VAVSDIRESARERVRRTSTTIRLYEDGTEVIDDPEVEAVAIATPAATHFSLARRALVRDQHVLVEKPMCASVAEAKELVALAEHNGVTLMVDHTYLFHGAVGRLRQLHQNGSLGAVSYYDSLKVLNRSLASNVSAPASATTAGVLVLRRTTGDRPHRKSYRAPPRGRVSRAVIRWAASLTPSSRARLYQNKA